MKMLVILKTVSRPEESLCPSQSATTVRAAPPSSFRTTFIAGTSCGLRGDYCVALGLLGDSRVRDRLLDELKGSGGNYAKCSAAACLGTLRRVRAARPGV